MKRHDRNDGPRTTCAGCGTACRSVKNECHRCAARRLAGEFYSPPELVDGRWVPRGGIVVWEAAS